MKKLQKLKLEALSNMLSRDQMKKIVGGYGSCDGYGTSCTPLTKCCGNMNCGFDVFWGADVCK